MTWNSVYGKEFRLSVRRTQHGTRGTSLFGKWRKAVMNSVSIAMESTEVKLENDQATFTARVGLMHHLSYEIRLVEVSSVEAYNLSASVFLDAHQEFAVGEFPRTRLMSPRSSLFFSFYHLASSMITRTYMQPFLFNLRSRKTPLTQSSLNCISSFEKFGIN